MQDIRLALRLIATDRWFSAAVVVTLSLGIGINTTAFTLVNAVLFKPVPFPDGDRLVAIGGRRTSDSQTTNVSPLDFADYRAHSSSFEMMEGVASGAATLSEPGVPAERYRLARVTSGLFRMVRTHPVIGRGLAAADEAPGAEPIVVLGNHVWRNRYNASPDVIGRQVRVNERPTTIVGVMPDGFRFPGREDLWTPFMPAAGAEKRDNRYLLVIGLLKPGTSITQANTDLDVVAARLEAGFPDTNTNVRARVETFHERFNGEVRIVFLLMLGAVGLVLLVACANVANMMLGRALTRHREMSIRAALGASRWHLVRQLLVESLVLSVVGALLGLALAKAGVSGFEMATANAGKPSWVLFTFDYPVLAYCTALCLLSGIVFGLVPALRSSRVDLNHALKEGGRTGTGRGGWLSGTLVVAQFALALVLLTGAGLLVQSLLASQVINGAMPRQQILTARVSLPSARYPDRAAQLRFFGDALVRLDALPGVIDSALMTQAPGLGAGSRRGLEVEGVPVSLPADRPSVPTLNVSPGYFHLFDLTVDRGRLFDDRDGAVGSEVAIVTREFATRYLPNRDAIGARVRFNADDKPGPWMTIVGLSADMVQGQQQAKPEPVLFVPVRQEDAGTLLMAVRSSGDASQLTGAMRSTIQAMDLDLALFDVRTFHEAVLQSRLFFRIFAVLFSIFGGMALLMAAVGLYAVMAQATTRRTREIGIRMALGATPAKILTTVMRRGVVQLSVGLVLGLGLAYAATGTMQSLLFSVAPDDPAVFSTAALVLVATGLIACWLPAWRAARVQPVQALSYEERA